MTNTQEATPARASLHDLVEHMLAILDTSDGELTPETDAALAELAPAIEAKVEGYAAVCARLDAEADALKALADKYRDRAKVKTNAVLRLKERLKDAMELMGSKRIATATVTASIQANPTAVEVLTTVDLVPDEFVVVTRKPDSAKIKQALESGANLSFARLTRGSHLRLR